MTTINVDLGQTKKIVQRQEESITVSNIEISRVIINYAQKKVIAIVENIGAVLVIDSDVFDNQAASKLTTIQTAIENKVKNDIVNDSIVFADR